MKTLNTVCRCLHAATPGKWTTCPHVKTKQKGARFDVTRLVANGSKTWDSLRQVYVEGVLG